MDLPNLNTLFAEAKDDGALYITAGILLTLVLTRVLASRDTRRRLIGIVLFYFAYAALGTVAGVLRARGPGAGSYNDVRLVCLVFGALSIVGATTLLVFDVLLPRIRIRAPRILRDVIGAAAAFLAVVSIATKLGFNLSGIIATSAVLTAVIGFSLQETLGNLMGGLALQLDNSIRVGDWIKVSDASGPVNGRVADIRWRYTAIETRNWETILIPNSALMKSQVVILGRRTGEPVQWRRWVWFNVDFRFSPTHVIDVVEQAVRSAPIEYMAQQPAPNCVLMEFHESYCRYALRYWLTNLAPDDPTDSVVRTRIYFALKRAGISLSIPAHAIFTTEDSAMRREAKAHTDQDRRARALGAVELFSHLDAEDRDKLARSLTYAPFARGETLTRQGAEAHWLYMVIEGRVSVRVAIQGGLEREVAQLGAGTFFGEMSLMTGAPRSATVVALTDVECYRLDKTAFQAIVMRRPEVAEDVAAVLARRRVELDGVKEDLGEEAKRHRVAATKAHLLDSIRSFFGLTEIESAAR